MRKHNSGNWVQTLSAPNCHCYAFSFRTSFTSTFFKERFRDTPYNQHNWTPEPRQVDHILATHHRLVDTLANRLRTGKQQALLDRGRHRGIHKPRLHRHNRDPRLAQAVAQPLQEDTDSTLGSPIDIVALPPAVARHRGDNRDTAALLLLKVSGQDSQERNHAGAVGGKFLHCLRHTALALLLVSQRTMRNQHHIKPIQCAYRALNHLLVTIKLHHIKHIGLYALRSTHLQIVPNIPKLLG